MNELTSNEGEWNVRIRPDCFWSDTMSDADIDLHISNLDAYSKLSDENLNTILRSYSETQLQRRENLNLLSKIDLENKSELLQQAQDGLQTLNHEMTLITNELTNRRNTKSGQNEIWAFPDMSGNDDLPLDLKVFSELIGNSFDEQDKLKFLEQYLSVVHYSKTHPLSPKQLLQVFHLKLKGKTLLFFSSLPQSITLKEKIRKLLTVFAYLHDETDRLAELENFKRESMERLDSVFLRLSSILDSSASLVPPDLRILPLPSHVFT